MHLGYASTILLLGVAGLAETQPAGDSNLDVAIAHYWSGNYRESVESLEPVCAELRQDEAVECLKYLGFSHVAVGDSDSARGAFLELLRHDAQYDLDSSEVSPKILQQFELARSDLVDGRFDRGRTLYRNKDYAGAKAALSAVLVMEPTHDRAQEYLQLANAQLALTERQAELQKMEAEIIAATAPPSPPTPEPSTPGAGTAEDAADTDGNRIYRVTSQMIRPELLRRVQPHYPEGARRARREGTVVASAVIQPDGTVSDVQIIRGVSKTIDDAASRAIRQWRYRPARIDARSVAVRTVIQLEFKLN